MWSAGDAPAVPEGLDALLPPWAQQLSLLTLLVLIVMSFVRGWIITRGQADREVAAERRASDIWEANATRSAELLTQISDAFDPVLSQNEAILRAVSEIQDEQRRMRDSRRPR